MQIITAESIIYAAWQQVFREGLVPNAWTSGLGLFFNVEIHIENFGYERDGNTHHKEWERDFYRSLQFVVTARHEVFVRKSESHVEAIREDKLVAGQWQNASNHDSCWHSDGLRCIWETLVEGHEFCWGHVPDAHQKSMNEMNRHCSVNTGVFSRGLIQLVRVETESDPERSGWRRLVSLKHVPFNLSLERTAEAERAKA